MYNKITPERLVVILGVAFVCLVVGLIATGINQYFYPKQSKSHEKSEQKMVITKKDFRLRIAGVIYLLEIDNIAMQTEGFRAVIDEPPIVTIKQKLFKAVQYFAIKHKTINFTLLEQFEGHLGYTVSDVCQEVEKMFGN